MSGAWRFGLPTFAASSFCAAMICWTIRMREFERLHEFLFGKFVGRAFDHDHVVLRADIDEIEVAVLALCVGRVGDELAVHATDAHGADRAVERNVADHERGARAVDGEHVRIVLAVGAEQHAR